MVVAFGAFGFGALGSWFPGVSLACARLPFLRRVLDAGFGSRVLGRARGLGCGGLLGRVGDGAGVAGHGGGAQSACRVFVGVGQRSRVDAYVFGEGGKRAGGVGLSVGQAAVAVPVVLVGVCQVGRVLF